VSTDARRPASFDTIGEIDEGELRAAVLEAALELDVFTTIGPRPMDLQEVALAIGADPRALAVLLDALCALGLLDKSSAGYELGTAAAAFLARGSESFGGDVVLRMSAARRRLAEVVRSGSAVTDLVAPSSGGFWAEFASHRLVTWPDEVEEELATWLDLGVASERGTGVRILDVACGSGTRSFGLAREDPEVRIVALDSAPVLEIAKKIAAQMGISERVELRTGDVTSTELGSGEFDVVLLSYLLYFFTPEDAQGLLSRVRQALKPGGLVVVRASIADEERREAADALLNAVDLLLWLPTSRVYTFAEYRDLLAGAGFVEIVRRGEEVVTAVRPA
jgi:2-polyprenyl-3-methyl-5-hydroxy-6-metoxy-1,4-benzoquinol methylase